MSLGCGLGIVDIGPRLRCRNEGPVEKTSIHYIDENYRLGSLLARPEESNWPPVTEVLAEVLRTPSN